MGEVEGRLHAEGVQLPEVPVAVAAYVPAVMSGALVFTAGQIPRDEGQILSPGVVGETVAVADARTAARRAVVQALAAVKAVTGDLDQVARIVRLTVYVRSAKGFQEQSQVADGASELLRAVFGAMGEHARSAVGVSELPLGSCVEIELVAEVRGR